ncbi:unnamed protein product [Paramecium sonneborni]|uniref:Uncharacterized protein n=1 Tax=Paramecium sonneborni TaxID=65129 RepID=A0A8S1KPP5_9CILI|nr:unnamed protein product [Paramecium sonneborni]
MLHKDYRSLTDYKEYPKKFQEEAEGEDHFDDDPNN